MTLVSAGTGYNNNESVIAERPRYVVFVSGKWRWRPTKEMRRHGFRLVTFGKALTDDDRRRADTLNAEWDDVRDSRPREAPRGVVYLIGFGCYVKIGRTADLRARVGELQVGAPELLTIYASMPATHRDERLLHATFAEYRLRGEWFRLEGRLRDWIERGCNLNEFQPSRLRSADGVQR